MAVGQQAALEAGAQLALDAAGEGEEDFQHP
jgi:hypothetical protein